MSTNTTSVSPFSDIPAAPPDAIFGIKQAFQADTRSEKVDLSVGIYQNDQGKTPNLEVVEEAFRRLSKQEIPAGYLPIDGLASYNQQVQKLIFGEGSEAVASGRVVTAQSVGGTGALRYGGDFLKRFFADSEFYVSAPTWANHRAIFTRAGYSVKGYPYLDKQSYGVDFDGMCSAISSVPAKSIVLFHACCHNPTGIDCTTEQWAEIIEVCKRANVIPFIDFAYQGFAEGVEEDANVVRQFADAGLFFLVAQSFSKNFSLYRRRTGTISFVAKDKEEASRVLSQLKTDIRTNNSNCPFEGAAAVDIVLSDSGLRSRWEAEVSEIRERIKRMRRALLDVLDEEGVGAEFEHLVKQNGMFSYSGLSKEQAVALRERCAVYMLDSGRMTVAALTPSNVEYVARSIAKVVKGEL